MNYAYLLYAGIAGASFTYALYNHRKNSCTKREIATNILNQQLLPELAKICLEYSGEEPTFLRSFSCFNPTRVVVSKSEMIYVLSSNTHVDVFNKDGRPMHSLKICDFDSIHHVADIAVNEKEEILVAYNWMKKIDVYSNEGKFRFQFEVLGENKDPYNDDHYIAVSSRHIYVINRDGNEWQFNKDRNDWHVNVFTEDGSFIRKWLLRGGYYHYPIVRSDDKYVYIGRRSPPAVCIYEENGRLSREIRIDYPGSTLYGISISPSGYIYIADNENNHLIMTNNNGTYLHGYKEIKGRRFKYPRGIAISERGLMYVCDDDQILVFQIDIS